MTDGEALTRLTDAELLAFLRERESTRRRAYAEQLRAVAEIEARGLAGEHGHRGVGGLVREMFALNPADARRMVAHARALSSGVAPSGAAVDASLPRVVDELAAGAIGPEHVEAIRGAVEALPPSATVQERAEAERILCEAATTTRPGLLARLGREISARLDPDGDRPREDLLEKPMRRLEVRQRPDGGVSGSFDLDSESGALLTNLLSPLAVPRTDEAGPDTRGRARRYGDALAEVVRLAARSPEAPGEAGEPVTLLVSVGLAELKQGAGRGLVDGYLELPSAQLRRMACDSNVAPVVLGTKGEPLDVGRTTRTVPRAVRRALVLRDAGCTFPTCDRKAKWCQAHHVRHWIDGGPTSLDNLTLLCGPHHRLLHHSDWEARMINGRPWYFPPAHVDPGRAPRRNALHAHRASVGGRAPANVRSRNENRRCGQANSWRPGAEATRARPAATEPCGATASGEDRWAPAAGGGTFDPPGVGRPPPHRWLAAGQAQSYAAAQPNGADDGGR
ncbi:hypothetical protein FHU38_002336 [Saccharomonospora amisosensis]|uniref:HNH nuclease domain-containing protein n=1 Tax=Saccharomonospora amisosensis TaxID=1128677 RepID=A0A7X5UQF6_9PSEU|nr:HNH endonuclease signature motif containing protein [Saccharomonospora amisosensis]NIJ11992.1 hypothetical protein [Saccharomonospora amisosensis]